MGEQERNGDTGQRQMKNSAVSQDARGAGTPQVGPFKQSACTACMQHPHDPRLDAICIAELGGSNHLHRVPGACTPKVRALSESELRLMKVSA